MEVKNVSSRLAKVTPESKDQKAVFSKEQKDDYFGSLLFLYSGDYKKEVSRLSRISNDSIQSKCRTALTTMKTKATLIFKRQYHLEPDHAIHLIEFGYALGILQSYSLVQNEQEKKIFWGHFRPLFEQGDAQAVAVSINILQDYFTMNVQ